MPLQEPTWVPARMHDVCLSTQGIAGGSVTMVLRLICVLGLSSTGAAAFLRSVVRLCCAAAAHSQPAAQRLTHLGWQAGEVAGGRATGGGLQLCVCCSCL